MLWWQVMDDQDEGRNWKLPACMWRQQGSVTYSNVTNHSDNLVQLYLHSIYNITTGKSAFNRENRWADGQMCKRRGDGREQRNRRATGVSNLKTRVGVREVRGYHAQIPVVGAHWCLASLKSSCSFMTQEKSIFHLKQEKNQVSHSFFWRKRHSSLNVQKENLNWAPNIHGLWNPECMLSSQNIWVWIIGKLSSEQRKSIFTRWCQLQNKSWRTNCTKSCCRCLRVSFSLG